jgi:RsiW-degrading membrane proteinase PrsW (M82 family)
MREARRARALGTLIAPVAVAALRVMPDAAMGIEGQSPLLSGEWVRTLSAPAATIGRALQNDVILVDPAVSREHARLIRRDGGWWIENISSGSPLICGEFELAPTQQVRVHSGDIVHLGDTSLQFLAPASPAEPVTPDAQPTLILPGATNLLSPGVTLQYALQGRFGGRGVFLLGLAGTLLLLLSSILTLGTAALIGHDALALGGAGRVFAALTVPLIPAIGAALLVALLDRYEREPPLLLLAAFIWGAVIAVPPVLSLEQTFDGLLRALFAHLSGDALLPVALRALSTGLIEEVVKAAGLFLLILLVRDEFDNVTDGVLYGILIGAGFALVENFVYFAYSSHEAFAFLVFGRVVLGWLGHSTFTALVGAGLGYSREMHLRRRGWLPPLLGLGAAVLLHTFFDFVAFAADAYGHSGVLSANAAVVALGTVLLDYVPLVATQLLLLRAVLGALGREAAIVREYLADEVGSGVVQPDEYALVQDATLRGAAEREWAMIYGLRAYLTARALHQSLTGLAFRRWHVAQGDPAKAMTRQPEDAYRARIPRLRLSLARQAEQLALAVSPDATTGALGARRE